MTNHSQPSDTHIQHTTLGRSSIGDRYSRQIRYSHIGLEGQNQLERSRIAIVGMGALGSVLAQHLVRAGVGYTRLIDRDIVEWSNLQRQMLYTEQDANEMLPKAAAAASRLRAINSSVTVEPVMTDLSSANASQWLEGVDLILDGTDNFSVRYLINDFSLQSGTPWIYGGAVGASGMTMTVIPHETACYRCLFPEPPAPGATDSCETAGVISPIVDIIASVQATDAIKLLSGNRDALHRTLFQVDLWNHAWLPINIDQARRSDCPACGDHHRYEFLNRQDRETVATALCGRQSVQLTPGVSAHLNLDDMAGRLSVMGQVYQNPYLLKLQLAGDVTFVLFPDGRAIVQGTEDSARARSIYAELLGI
ncbi:ThiF family adenylyltransferase [Paenibacillus paeoniae]|uniref:Thiazole biosynthesis adenylyltransferase ThiF n=1 Tax=Paenibacillus paeoniae TaxID=2292705 RepID=A0A371P220_9BACL|nr:ThiF family adenylyltransferase [Paenibacillus paeoniae]REK69366.1 thiazole biosynthesis adenylyltransferase ThiF [Paenibacillus paeoniae]